MGEEKQGFFARLRSGLTKTRDNIVNGMNRVFLGHSAIDDDFYDELEEIMIMGDMGVQTTELVLEQLRQQVKEQHIKEPSACRELLIRSIREQMHVDEHAYDFEEGPAVVLIIGVNGVGKTTSVGKLAANYKARGKKVLIAAADTFRAAAYDQLKVWSERAGVDMIAGAEGADPASVVYDAVSAAKARHTDILLCDTAGRLHNKKNLMNELEKIGRIISREFPDAKRENLVVLDAATGQNALSQAREFAQVTDLTGIILTKMDGSSKGGIAIAVESELGIPVKYIGVGEQQEDLQRFDPDDFVAALFDAEPEHEDAMGDEHDVSDGPGASKDWNAAGGADDANGSKEMGNLSSDGRSDAGTLNGAAAGPDEEKEEEEDPWAFFAAKQDEKNGRR